MSYLGDHRGERWARKRKQREAETTEATSTVVLSHADFWRIYHALSDIALKARSPLAPYFSADEIKESARFQRVLRDELERLLRAHTPVRRNLSYGGNLLKFKKPGQ